MSAEVSPMNDPILVYRQKFVDAVKAGDVDAVVSFCVDDVVIMSPNDSTLYGKAEWREWLEEYFQYFRFVAFNEPERSVVVNGDFATEHTTYMLAIVPVGGTNRIRDDG